MAFEAAGVVCGKRSSRWVLRERMLMRNAIGECNRRKQSRVAKCETGREGS